MADTNNHAVRVIDLARGAVTTVAFPNPDRLQIGGRTTVVGGAGARERLTLVPQTVAPGAGEIVLRIALPEGYKVNADAPSELDITVTGEAATIETGEVPFRAAEVRLPITLPAGAFTLDGVVTTYYCEAVNESLCFFDEAPVTGAITVAAGTPSSEIVVERAITPPRISVRGL